MPNIAIEIIGIVATLMIIISMSFNTVSIKGNIWMRITNIVGSFVFVVYGFLLPAYSTGILNSVLVVVNTFHLIKVLKENKQQKQEKDTVNK